MIFDFPKPQAGDMREDVRQLWEDLWRIVEQLRLMDEEMARLEKAAETAVSKVSAGAEVPARVKHLLPFGKVTETTASAKKATVQGISELKSGVACYIVNDGSVSQAGFTLDVNGLGAKKVYNTLNTSGAAVTTQYAANNGFLFVYNEARDSGNGGWDMNFGYDSNTNTLAYQVRTQTTDRTVADRLTRYQLCFCGTDDKIFPAALIPSGSNYNVGTDKTINTARAFDPRRPILYYGSTTNQPAGSQPPGSVMWRQYASLDLRYSFNCGTGLTACKGAYVRCAPTADGFLQMDGNDCLVQDLPNTADGKVYLYLGMVHGNYVRDMELDPEHPCYEYRDGAVKPWNGG